MEEKPSCFTLVGKGVPQDEGHFACERADGHGPDCPAERASKCTL